MLPVLPVSSFVLSFFPVIMDATRSIDDAPTGVMIIVDLIDAYGSTIQHSVPPEAFIQWLTQNNNNCVYEERVKFSELSFEHVSDNVFHCHFKVNADYWQKLLEEERNGEGKAVDNMFEDFGTNVLGTDGDELNFGGEPYRVSAEYYELELEQ